MYIVVCEYNEKDNFILGWGIYEPYDDYVNWYIDNDEVVYSIFHDKDNEYGCIRYKI